MTTPFTIFLLSLIALIFLIVHKVLELHKGTTLVSTEMRDRGDEIIVDNVVEKVKLFLAKGWLASRRTVLSTRAVTQRVTVDALHKVQHTTVKLIERTKRAGAGKSGTGSGAAKKPAGSVSFFLKHVSDEAKRVTAESAAVLAATAAAAESEQGTPEKGTVEVVK